MEKQNYYVDFLSTYEKLIVISKEKFVNDHRKAFLQITLDEMTKMSVLFEGKLSEIIKSKRIPEDDEALFKILRLEGFIEKINFGNLLDFFTVYVRNNAYNHEVSAFLDYLHYNGGKLKSRMYRKAFTKLMLAFVDVEITTSGGSSRAYAGKWILLDWLLEHYGELEDMHDMLARRLLFLESQGIISRKDNDQGEVIKAFEAHINDVYGLFVEEADKALITAKWVKPSSDED